MLIGLKFIKLAKQLKQIDMEKIRNLSIEEYHKKEGISASRLKEALKSTAHFFTPQESKESEAFLIGQAFEDCLTEPENFYDKYWILDLEQRPEADKTMASKLNKEWKENLVNENASKVLLTAEQNETINKMVVSAQKNEAVMHSLKDSLFQQSYFWKDEETGLICKTRPDIVKHRNENAVIINDIKTTVDASPEGFARSFANFHYGIQAAMQIDGVEKALGVQVDYYTYTVVEKQAPFLTQIYTLSDEDIQTFKHLYKSLLKKVKKAMDDEEYIALGYCDTYGKGISVLELEIPQWYINNINKKIV